jgi:large subunit ribosomal protein L9
MAVAATESNKKIVEQERQSHTAKKRTQSEARICQDNGRINVTIAQKAGRTISSLARSRRKTAEALEKQNFTIDRRKIVLDEPIKQLGQHKGERAATKNVTTEIIINVLKKSSRVRPDGADGHRDRRATGIGGDRPPAGRCRRHGWCSGP